MTNAKDIAKELAEYCKAGTAIALPDGFTVIDDPIAPTSEQQAKAVEWWEAGRHPSTLAEAISPKAVQEVLKLLKSLRIIMETWMGFKPPQEVQPDYVVEPQ